MTAGTGQQGQASGTLQAAMIYTLCFSFTLTDIVFIYTLHYDSVGLTFDYHCAYTTFIFHCLQAIYHKPQISFLLFLDK